MTSPLASACLALAIAGVSFVRPVIAAPVFVPDDYPTIQQAVDAADTVHVRPGFYLERPRLPGNGRRHLLRSYPSSGHVVVGGLIFDGRLQGTDYKVQGLEFDRTVALETHDQLVQLTFERCRFDSGLVQTSFLGLTDWSELAFRKCTLRGEFAGTFNYTYFEDDTLLAGGLRIVGVRGTRVLRCVFEGPGTTAFSYSGPGIARANANTIRHYDVGIQVGHYDSDLEALDNSIVDCPVAGIQLDLAHRVTLSRNRILDCGQGIFVEGMHDVIVSDNRVYHSTHAGISTAAHNRSTTITGNVVGRSGGAGIVTRNDTEGAIENNTSYSNNDHGFVLGIDPHATVSIRRNIAFGNAGFGLSIGPGSAIQIGCNDWFANAGGNVLGRAPGASDLTLDPLFCDLGSDSVGLALQSALLDVPGCGTIGALGAACGGPTDPSAAGGVAVTPCEPYGWTTLMAGGGLATITAAYPHPTGSLELSRAAPDTSAAFARANPNADPLATLSALSIALYREGGSAAPDAAPAVRLAVENPRGERSTLIWEAGHNGLAVFPTGQWNSYDLSQGFFWQRAESPRRVIDRYDRRLADWLEPGTVADADADVSVEVGPDARVLGYEIGTVDGGGDFTGAADDFRIAFGPRDTTFHFERTPVVAVGLAATETFDCGSLLLHVRIDPPGVQGPVEFRDGDTVIGAVNVANIGAAWFTVRDLAVGTHRFSASFGGGECVVRSQTIDQVVKFTPTAITLASDLNPAKLGDWVALTARLSSTYPTGVVDFRDNEVLLGTVSVATGVATWTGVLPQGAHRMTALYTGDHCHDSTSAVLTQIVGGPPKVSVSDLQVTERNDGQWVVNFLLSMNGTSRDTVTVDFTTRDGSATVADHDYQPTAGTARFLPGQVQTLVPLVVIGDVKPEPDETLTLALSNPTITILGDSTGIVTLFDDDRPVIQFGNYSPVTVEGTGDTTNVVFYVALEAACSESVTVHYETEDGTATAVQDYLPVSGALSYAPGDRVREVAVPVLGDSVREETENFRLVLSSSVNARIGIGASLARIRDDDLIGPNVSIDDASVIEGDSAGAVMRFRVRLSRPDGREVRVTYGAIDSTARMDLDYQPKFGSLSFPPMTTEVFLEVPLLGDDYCEDGDETFLMRISNPVDAEIVRSRAVGTIVDDDCIPLTLLQPFTAEIVPDGVALRWRLNAAALTSFVERSDSPAGPWTGIATGAVVNDGSISAVDRSTQPQRTYWYRLVARSTSNTVSRFGPIEVITPEHMPGPGPEPDPIHDWALGRVAPNPSPGSTEIEFFVARGGRVRLEILDVQGRRVALLADGAYAPGAHGAVWDGGGENGTAEPGLYFVRFRAVGRTWLRRLAIVP